MKSYNLAVIGGDGTGPEVVREAIKVLDVAAKKFGIKLNYTHYDIGGERYLKTGEVLPDSVLAELRKFPAILLGAIGHPGDIERLRMAAIELASTEGFTRSAADVSLRRLAYYSLSPVMKAAFEQVYGAPYLARLLFAEVGPRPEDDLFLRVEYDGAIATNGGDISQTRSHYAVLSASRHSTDLMEKFFKSVHRPDADFRTAANNALDAWSVGHLTLGNEDQQELPDRDTISKHRQEQLATVGIEAAVLERNGKNAIRYRTLTDEQVRPVVSS